MGRDVPADWGGWQDAGPGVRYRLQRTEKDLFIEFAPEPGSPPGALVLNSFLEELGGRPGTLSVPLDHTHRSAERVEPGGKRTPALG
ncbi:hypothetical protein [Symbiobacterium thermophilum]|uniref:hypothetical protein n=1 Tax=Symbiobacterium thermophilum TaxID=2734 RepID=UPI0035C6B21F